MSRLVEGVGINDANYVVKTQQEFPKENGKRVRKLTWICPFYQTWKNMLMRAYNKKYHEKFQTYKNCKVCDEWLTFSNFKSWMEQQDWKGKHLDKDLLVLANNVYSPDTCCFIDSRLNNFLVKNDKKRNGRMLGVARRIRNNRVEFVASCWDDSSKSQYEGAYSTEKEGHKAWQKAKIRIAKSLLDTYHGIERQGVLRVIAKIQHDLDNNLVTEDF